MAEYKPLFVYLEPASIPQVVAHIQKYLAENPIVSDPESIAEAIREYIEEHPEIIAVASVNGKTGNVVLTGSDININASSAVSVETQILNLASMISTAGADIAQINAQLETIYTNIGTIETNVSNNTSAISALQTSVEGQGTRLSTAENDIDALESAQTAQGTRLNAAEGNISSLQTRMTQAETDIDNNESSIETLQTRMTQAESAQTSLNTKLTARAVNSGITSLNAYKCGNVVQLHFNNLNYTASSQGWQKIGTLPTELRPFTWTTFITNDNQIENYIREGYIEINGEIFVYFYSSHLTGELRNMVVYMTANDD